MANDRVRSLSRKQVKFSIKENLERDLHKNVGMEAEWEGEQVLPVSEEQADKLK